MNPFRALIALSCAVEAVAQLPPTPDAVLVAGAPLPFTGMATDLVMQPLHIAIAPDATLYVQETGRVWRVDASGRVAAVAGPWDHAAHGPEAIGVDGAGDLYVAGDQYVWEQDPSGQVSTVTSQLYWPGQPPVFPIPVSSIAVDAKGVIYLASQQRVWKLSSGGQLQPFAGTGYGSSSAPGYFTAPALQVNMGVPIHLTVDAAGNVYFVEENGVDQVTPDGMLVRLFAGQVQSYAMDAAGNLYVGGWNSAGIPQIFRVNPDQSTQAIAGGSWGFSQGCTPDAPGVPLAIHAGIKGVYDLTFDRTGDLYFIDLGNALVRRIRTNGVIETVAGNAGGGFSGDGGLATDAVLGHPTAMALDSSGNVYFADRDNNRIRRIGTDGIIQTIAGSGATILDDPACLSAPTPLLNPSGVAVDAGGNVYIADTGHYQVLELAADGTLAVIAGTGQPGVSGDGGPAVDADLGTPTGLAADGQGGLYVAGQGIRYIAPDGTIQTPFPYPGSQNVAVDSAGNVYATGYIFTPDGRAIPVPGDTTFAVDGRGSIYYSGTTVRLARLNTDCQVLALAAAGDPFGGMAAAPNGYLYVADTNANRIWRIPAPAADGGVAPVRLTSVPVLNGATKRPVSLPCTPSFFGTGGNCPQYGNENVAPGETVVIQGVCLGPTRFVPGSLDAAGYVASAIGDTQVFFNGTAAPLLSASSGELVAVVPYEIAGASTALAVVARGGIGINVNLQTSASSVGIFRPANPVVYTRGSAASLVITGEGQTDPPGVTGKPAAEPLPEPLAPVAVSVGGIAAEVISVAPDPGTIGSTRVTFRVPDTVKPGMAAIGVMVGSSFDSFTAPVN
ncbi:MAG TPA: hypothetical protein VE959_02405 [Bryobacteraceae bacterium]|nr:hypothetical protein [Bryobacteraceae bacterium]